VPDLQVNGRRIAYRAEGAGPLVILLHCSSSHSGQWKPYVEAWSDRYRLVAPDHHGYGRSDPLPEDGRPFQDHDAAILPALMAAEGAERAHILGHSRGGAIGFFAAREAPGLYLSLTMIEPVLFAVLDETRDAHQGERPMITEKLGGLIAEGDREAAAEFFIDFWSGPGTWARTAPELQAYIRATIHRVHSDWLGALPDAPGQIRLSDGARLTMPVALWRGTASRASAQAIAAHVAGSIPGAALHDVAGADHMAAVFEPQRFIGPVGEFLDRAAANQGQGKD